VSYKKRHKVLGRVENTTVVLLMGDYLYATVMRLLPYDKSSWLGTDALAWCDGCVERLAERIKAKAEEQRTPDYAAQGEAGYSTALAVRSMAEAEDIANYDAQYGAGSWARKLEREVRSEAYWAKYYLELAAKEETAAIELAAKIAAETPAERARRERAEERARAKEERENDRYWDRETRKEYREARRRSSDAFQSGRTAGRVHRHRLPGGRRVPDRAHRKIIQNSRAKLWRTRYYCFSRLEGAAKP
jgi:hypothetical protein